MLNRKAGEADIDWSIFFEGKLSFVTGAAPSRLTPTSSFKVLPTHFYALGTQFVSSFTMVQMRQSSEWRLEDEGSDSLVNLNPMDREGVGGQVLTSNPVRVRLPK